MLTLRSFFEDREVALPRESLKKEILLAVWAVRNEQMKRRLQVVYIGGISSLGALVYTSLTFGESFLESDFWSILSLIFSDLTVAASYWNDFLFSLLETFPTLSVAAVFLPTFIFLIFLNMYVGTRSEHYSY